MEFAGVRDRMACYGAKVGKEAIASHGS